MRYPGYFTTPGQDLDILAAQILLFARTQEFDESRMRDFPESNRRRFDPDLVYLPLDVLAIYQI